jgi:hypothetical protein
MAKRGEEREKRLAEALRENLRRRKAQAREGRMNPPRYGEGDQPQAGGGGPETHVEPPPPPPVGGGPPPRSGEDL